jgi:anaerobic selenocysteine-containing dehydrogenase
MAGIRGDRKHPSTAGYLCEKAQALDWYQSHSERLVHPLRRTAAGGFEEVSWETAIAEVGQRLAALRDTHGGQSIAFYGCALTGNQLALLHAMGFRHALRSPFLYHALGQEKTGDFWLNGEIFGSQACHTTTNDLENADFVLLTGTNPWQAHGFPRARKVLREIARDERRTLVVIDPRRTETAALADVHLAPRPGTDAFLLSAMLAIIVREGLENRPFLAERTTGYERVRDVLMAVPIDAYIERAGVDKDAVRRVARGFATASAACARHDLGLEQSRHSTLNVYLEKLLYLITGNFGRKGSNNFHSQTVPLLWHCDPKAPEQQYTRTRVNGMLPIGGFHPPNILPSEIDTDHPERVRSVFVDSANPIVTGADAQAYRKAFEKLELLVVVDTAMTETAEVAHYILPARSQFEKWTCTFFNWGFPENHLHLRHPLVEAPAGPLTEQEIYLRLARTIGEDFAKNPLLGPVTSLQQHPAMADLDDEVRDAAAPVLLACLGYAQKHAAAVRRAGLEGKDEAELAVALFRRIISSPSGAVISRHEYEDTFSFIETADRKIHLAVESMLEWLGSLASEGPAVPDPRYPFVLSAGERRSSNATTVFRDPRWRKAEGTLRIHPEDARELGVSDGDQVVCQSEKGEVEAKAQLDEDLRRGHVSLPHGFGLAFAVEGQPRQVHGPAINNLTSSADCDPIARTPHHKTVPVRLHRRAG